MLSSHAIVSKCRVNAREEDVASNKRVSCVLQEIRKRAGTQEGARISAAEADDYHVHIVSKNTFPTAAGLASSAAGYACLSKHSPLSSLLSPCVIGFDPPRLHL